MISKKLFGTLSDGREVDIYELKNANGVSASVITYGATWQSLFAPDRDGNFEDVLIGFDDLKGHVDRSDYQGQIVGRYANRIRTCSLRSFACPRRATLPLMRTAYRPAR